MFDLGSLKNCNNSVSSCLTKTTNGFSELETTKKKEQTSVGVLIFVTRTVFLTLAASTAMFLFSDNNPFFPTKS